MGNISTTTSKTALLSDKKNFPDNYLHDLKTTNPESQRHRFSRQSPRT
jgi:hypothetical protein